MFGGRDDWPETRLAEIRNGGTVPPGTLALPLRGGSAILRSGEELPSRSILVPLESLSITLSFPKLADRDGTPANLTLELLIDPPDGPTGLRLLAESMGGKDRWESADLQKVLAPLWAEPLALRASRGLWTDEAPLSERLELSDIPDSVEEVLFDRGLRLDRIVSAQAESAALAKARETRRKRREEAARIRERLDFLELWKKEEQGEALARSEVERLAAHLEQQGLLRKIEHDQEEHFERLKATEEMSVARERLHRRLERERLASRVEIDEARLKVELEQAEKLREAFEKNGWLALVQAIEDPDGRTRLLERLIEKEMTPEQLAARGVAQSDVDRLEARIEALQKSLESPALPAPLAGSVEGLPATRRVWLAAGLALYRIDGDPATAEREARPVLPPEEIGYLRSVRVIHKGPRTILAVGGQGGVGIYDPDSSHWEFYRFRPGEAGRGGANSVVSLGTVVLASHSRLGLSIWKRNEPQSLDRPFETSLAGGRSTRSVQTAPGGGFWFAHGNEVFHGSPGAGAAGLVSVGSLPERVTALCASGDELWAGTQDGRLFRRVASPDRGAGDWRPLPFGTSGPIYQIAAPQTAGEKIWLIGARQPAVHVLDSRGGKIAEYLARYPVRWVGATAGGPIAVDRFGQHLIVWNWGNPETPVRRIRVADQIHAIAVEHEPPKGEIT